jgi:RNA polymerase sigma-70 factor (ECF subfamily)
MAGEHVMGAGNGISDEQLFGRFQNGDETALAELFSRHRTKAQAIVGARVPKRMRRRVAVSDVLQEAELAVFCRQSVFEDRGPGSFRKWYFAIAENKLRETLRHHGGAQKRAVHNEVSRDGRPMTNEIRGNGPSPSDAAMAAEFIEQMRATLATLPEDYRRVLELTRSSGLTLAEAAWHLGRSREATKKLYGRAFVRFQQAFREQHSASPIAPEAQRES